MPAWRVGPDIHLCTAPSAHGAGPVTPGAPTVLINGFPAARVTDFVVEPMGGPNPIVAGCPTVMIGMAIAPPAAPPLARMVAHGLDQLEGWVLFEATPQLDVGKVESEAKLGAELDLAKTSGKVEARASAFVALLKGELPLKLRVRIPHTDQFVGVAVTLEGSLLSAGGELAAGGVPQKDSAQRVWGAKVGTGLVGAGVTVGFDVGPAGPAYPEMAKGPGQ
jgi:hypothetical protein